MSDRTYPRWQYHATEPAKIIQGPEQEAEGWYDTPVLLKAALTRASMPRPRSDEDLTGIVLPADVPMRRGRRR